MYAFFVKKQNPKRHLKEISTKEDKGFMRIRSNWQEHGKMLTLPLVLNCICFYEYCFSVFSLSLYTVQELFPFSLQFGPKLCRLGLNWT